MKLVLSFPTPPQKCQFQDLYEELMSMILSRSQMEFNETLALTMLSFEEIGNLDEFQVIFKMLWNFFEFSGFLQFIEIRILHQ